MCVFVSLCGCLCVCLFLCVCLQVPVRVQIKERVISTRNDQTHIKHRESNFKHIYNTEQFQPTLKDTSTFQFNRLSQVSRNSISTHTFRPCQQIPRKHTYKHTHSQRETRILQKYSYKHTYRQREKPANTVKNTKK